MNGGKLSRDSRISTKINCYPGATVEEIEEHMDTRLKYAKYVPNTVIIHEGGNNLSNGDTVGDITNAYEKLTLNLKVKGVQNVALSAVTFRDKLKVEIPELNQSLRQLSQKLNCNFISNSFITFKYHLCWDKVHLNYDGVEQMEDNFSKFLRRINKDQK